MENISITFPEAKDETYIRSLLLEADLPFEDVGNHMPNFIVVKDKGHVIGAVGIEAFGEVGLLRSLVIASQYRGRGIAKMLYYRIAAYANLLGIRKLYLLTTTAEAFFVKLAFVKVERNNIPKAIRNTKEFQSLCPASAICMTKDIDSEVNHFPKEILRLETDVPGAKFWGIALGKVMFTYFEVSPHTKFEPHKHESKQITFALKGELFFEVTDRTICVRAGDVIAIPSNVFHAAYTKERRVKAIDAWSPVRRELIRKREKTNTTPSHDCGV